MVCTFFGHRDTPDTVAPVLRRVIEELILRHGVSLFYVGHRGNFDAMAIRLLTETERKYGCRFFVVLPYLPRRPDPFLPPSNTILPDGFEGFPPRYAIDRANRWMLAQSDIVVTCVNHATGGAARWKETARKQGKTVIELTEQC